MKRKIILPLLCMLIAFNNSYAQTQLKVMSYNIRLDVASDGENRWEARRDKVAALMNYYEADFIGSQEVQHHQLQYLLTKLTGYRYIGVGRDDGKTAGEYSCIFYSREKYKVLKQSTFWLSQTPDSVSYGWNAACRRVCTYGLFENKQTKQKLWVFNTHFDHMGDTARIESAKLITAKVKQLTAMQQYPVVVMGDFNSQPTEAPAQYMNAHFENARNICKEKPYGPVDTWEGFEFSKKPDGCIDYIFVSKDKKWLVKKFATITDSYDMKYPSDHFPVFAKLELKK